MKWTDWLTLGIAVWGAALSSGLAWREIRGDKRRLKVTCSEAVAALPDGTVAWFITITAVNVGKRLVEVKSGGLLLSDGNQFIQPASRIGPNPFGRRLGDGESLEFRFDSEVVEHAANDPKRKGKFMKAFVRDAEGRTYSAGLSRELRKRLNRRRKPIEPGRISAGEDRA